jgi:hypothetical protein
MLEASIVRIQNKYYPVFGSMASWRRHFACHFPLEAEIELSQQPADA